MKYRRALAFCLLSTLSLGCLARSPRTVRAERVDRFVVHLDSRFSNEQRDVILSGFDAWEKATRGVVTFVVSPHRWDDDQPMDFKLGSDGCTVDVYVASVSSKRKTVRRLDDDLTGNTLGYTARKCESKYVALVMDRITSAENLRRVAMHEAGHVCGLEHIPIPNEAAMYPSQDKAASCVSRLDLKAFCDPYGCRIDDMAPCDR